MIIASIHLVICSEVNETCSFMHVQFALESYNKKWVRTTLSNAIRISIIFNLRTQMGLFSYVFFAMIGRTEPKIAEFK